METILSIKETYGGYDVQTTEQVVELRIKGDTICCENFGYFMSEDDLPQFIGAQLLKVEITDTALKTYLLPEGHEYRWTACLFVTLTTSKGPLQFVAYNNHNGYYGHNASVCSKQLTHEEIL
jgi:hypothetical protein